MSSSLTLSNVSKTFYAGSQTIRLFEDVSYSFLKGHSYAVTGISGTGKSTLLGLLSSIERPTSGTVAFNGQGLESMRKEDFFQKIGIVFQVAHLIKELSVLDNVCLKGILFGMPRQVCRENGYELLERVGMRDKALSYPSVLSGGESQRVAVSRALFLKPDFILADEPTAHLDETNREIILNLLIEYQMRYGTGIIVTSHDPYVAAGMNISLALSHGALQAGSALKKESQNQLSP